MDKAVRISEEIGIETQVNVQALYNDSITDLVEKYRPVLEKIEKFEEDGKPALARALFRSSGMLEDFSKAIACAGMAAAKAIKNQREKISLVMADDDSEKA